MLEQLSNFAIGTAHAQNHFFDQFNPFGVNSGPGGRGTFNTVVNNAITWFLAIAALIAFIYLVVSGINYITAGGDAEKATKARAGILNAIIGIVVIVLAWVIVRFAIGLGQNLTQ